MSIKNILKKLNSRNVQIFPSINTLTKIIFIFLIAVTVTFFVKNVLAALPTENLNAIKNKQAALEKGNNQESWMNDAASSNALVGVNALVGPIPDEVLEGKNATGWVPGGIVGVTNKGIASLYNKPFSGTEYIASIKNNFLGKQVYAQSTGFQGLLPILPLWKGFRNVAYTFFSLIFIIMGIMIMLRVKISPQAVLTIQNSIPKIITSMILVTFSYAIVGLLIDLSYAVEAIFLSVIFNVSGGNPFSSGTFQPSLNELIKSGNIIGITFNLLPAYVILAITALISGIIALVAGVLTLGPGAVLGAFAFFIIILVVVVMVLWYLLKFLFGLTKSYVTIILKTIIAPLEIALGAIPNMKMGFGSWFTEIIANILVFPITIILITLINALIKATISQNLWMPPGVDGLNSLMIAGGGILPVAFGLGGLMLLSKLPAMIPEFIFQIKPSPFGKAIGEGFAGVGKLSQKGVGAETSAIKSRFMKSNTDSQTGVFNGKRGAFGWKEKLWDKYDPRIRTK